MATVLREMTEEEFLALPDEEGVERELIRGELRERPMTTRAFAHSVVIGNISYLLKYWSRQRPAPRGCVVAGEARVRLRPDPPTFVGVDVAYLARESRPDRPRRARYVDGPPLLVVEVLSPSDTLEDVDDKVVEYLDAGVSLVWVVNPRFSTVTAHRAGSAPRMFSGAEEIDAEPLLPGFRVPVADFFEELDD